MLTGSANIFWLSFACNCDKTSSRNFLNGFSCISVTNWWFLTYSLFSFSLFLINSTKRRAFSKSCLNLCKDFNCSLSWITCSSSVSLSPSNFLIPVCEICNLLSKGTPLRDWRFKVQYPSKSWTNWFLFGILISKAILVSRSKGMVGTDTTGIADLFSAKIFRAFFIFSLNFALVCCIRLNSDRESSSPLEYTPFKLVPFSSGGVCASQ